MRKYLPSLALPYLLRLLARLNKYLKNTSSASPNAATMLGVT